MKRFLTFIISIVLLILSTYSLSGCSNGTVANQQNNDTDSIYVGDEYMFGSYEQDNDLANGKEDIQWIVLEKNDEQLLLISKYAIDAIEYNGAKTDVNWESCSLRSWLNNYFYNEAFSNEQQKAIEISTVIADNNPDFSENPGNDTEDKVYLLSKKEFGKYFISSSKTCFMTPYCKAQKLEKSGGTFDGTDKCWWWLRGAGEPEQKVYHVNTKGETDKYGFYKDIMGVRPVIRLNIR